MVVKYKNHYTPKELEDISNLTFMSWVFVFCLIGVVIAMFWVVYEKQLIWPKSWVNGALIVILGLCCVVYYLSLTLMHIAEEYRRTCTAVYILHLTFRDYETGVNVRTATHMVYFLCKDLDYAQKIVAGDYDALMGSRYVYRIESQFLRL